MRNELFFIIAAVFLMMVLFVVGGVILFSNNNNNDVVKIQHRRHHNNHIIITTGITGAAGSTGATGASNDSPSDDFPFQATFQNMLALVSESGYGPGVSFDENLNFGWGLTIDYTSGPNFNKFWVACNGNNLSTGSINQYLLNITGVNNNTTGIANYQPIITPLAQIFIDDLLSGIDMNVTGAPGGFVIQHNGVTGAALLVTVSEHGNIWAWNPSVSANAIQQVSNSTGNFKDVLFDRLGRLWVANWGSGFVDIYDSNWTLINSITDINDVDNGYAPYHLFLNDDKTILVTFAFQNDQFRPDIGTNNNIFIDRFDRTTFNFIERFAGLAPFTTAYGVTSIGNQGLPFEVIAVVSTDGPIKLLRNSDGLYLQNAVDVFGNAIIINGGLDIIFVPTTHFGITGLNNIGLVTSNRYNGTDSFIHLIAPAQRLEQN